MSIFLLINHCYSSFPPSPLNFEKHCQLIIAIVSFITFHGSRVKVALWSSTVGGISDQTSLLLLSEIHNLVAVRLHLSQWPTNDWLSRDRYQDRLIPRRVGLFQWMTLAQDSHLAPTKLLRLPSHLRFFHPAFVLSLFSSQGSELASGSISYPCLLGRPLPFSYRCFP